MGKSEVWRGGSRQAGSGEIMTFKGFERPEQNYSKLPHSFIDVLPQIDTMAEMKVVLYLLRHTWGFSEFGKPKKLTTDEFCNGRKKKDQSRMDNGTGLSENSVRSGLEKAIEHGFILVETDETDKARIEKWYCLNMDDSSNFESRGANFEDRGAEFEDRSEKETKERKEQSANADYLSATEKEEADKKFLAILEFERMAREKMNSGIWRGRELIPPHLLIYADWWHSITNIDIKTKKPDSEWLKAFSKWYDNQVTLSTLDEAYAVEVEWKKVIAKPSELTAKAIAIQALPKPYDKAQQNAITTEGGFYVT